jgi:hypothetical protein
MLESGPQLHHTAEQTSTDRDRQGVCFGSFSGFTMQLEGWLFQKQDGAQGSGKGAWGGLNTVHQTPCGLEAPCMQGT